MKIEKYQIVEGMTRGELEDKVMGLIKAGWQPLAPLLVTRGGIYTQAMVVYEVPYVPEQKKTWLQGLTGN